MLFLLREFLVFLKQLYNIQVAIALGVRFDIEKQMQFHDSLRMSVESTYACVSFREINSLNALHQLGTLNALECATLAKIILTKGFQVFPDFKAQVCCTAVGDWMVKHHALHALRGWNKINLWLKDVYTMVKH